MPDLILVRGTPGSGRTTKANALKGDTGIVVSPDDYSAAPGSAHVAKLPAAQQYAEDAAERLMCNSHPLVIVDNFNYYPFDYAVYLRLANTYGYTVKVVEPDSPQWLAVKPLLEAMRHRPSDLEDIDALKTHAEALAAKSHNDVPASVVLKMLIEYDPAPKALSRQNA